MQIDLAMRKTGGRRTDSNASQIAHKAISQILPTLTGRCIQEGMRALRGSAAPTSRRRSWRSQVDTCSANCS